MTDFQKIILGAGLAIAGGVFGKWLSVVSIVFTLQIYSISFN